MNAKIWLILAALLGASGVTLGAYHAHGLQEYLEYRGSSPSVVAKRLDQCDVAVRYQMVHALALLGVGLLAARVRPSGWAKWLLGGSGVMFVAGVTLFSGGLYLIVFADNALHWAIVPLGGLSLIVAWLLLAAAVSLATFDARE